MSDRVPLKSDGVFVSRTISRSKTTTPGRCLHNDNFNLLTPKIIFRTSLAFKLYLKLNVARPISKIVSCLFVTVALTEISTRMFETETNRNCKVPLYEKILFPEIKQINFH